jgi:hypothetical protein
VPLAKSAHAVLYNRETRQVNAKKCVSWLTDVYKEERGLEGKRGLLIIREGFKAHERICLPNVV